MTWWLLAAQGVDLTPILVVILGALLSGGAGSVLTIRYTSRKLSLEGDELEQRILSNVEESHNTNILTMESIRNSLRDELAKTRTELEATKAALALTEEKLRTLQEQADRVSAEARQVAAERDLARTEAEHEREMLQHRITELEEKVTDLLAQDPSRLRRRRDPT